MRIYEKNRSCIVIAYWPESVRGELSYAENVSTADNSKTYELVNTWSGDATEGDPITVHYLQGWNQDKVTVGKDETSQVTIEDYGGGNGGDATVLGKNIAFTGGFTTGGAITAGNAATDSISAVTVNAMQPWGQNAGGTVNMDGKTISVTGSQGVNVAGGSTLSLGTRYMTGNLHIQILRVSGGSQAEVTVNGSVAVTGTSNQDELAWFFQDAGFDGYFF